MDDKIAKVTDPDAMWRVEVRAQSGKWELLPAKFQSESEAAADIAYMKGLAFGASYRVVPPPAVATDLVSANAKVLLPMLVFLRKFFRSVKDTRVQGGPSRFTPAEEVELLIGLQGFTPEDFNSLKSLANSMGADLEALLDEAAKNTPQMARPELREREARRLSGNTRLVRGKGGK